MVLDEIYVRWLRKLVLDHAPTKLWEALVTIYAILAAFGVRLAIEWTGGTAIPFLMTYPATMVAVLLAGLRPGLAVALFGTVINIKYVLPRWEPGRAILTPNTIANVCIAALSLAIIIWITSAFRKASIRLRDQSAREIETLGLLIEEMDHRTKNNFQIAAIMLDRAIRPTLSDEAIATIHLAASRLMTIARSYENLMTSDKNVRVAPLDEHIHRIVQSFESGLAPDHVRISVQSDAIILDQQCNLVIGLIVSEWMTNSIKYAFGDHQGRISVSAARRRTDLVVVVSDDGQAAASGDIYPGTGSRLVRSLATTIGARVETEVSHGTRCSLILPVGA